MLRSCFYNHRTDRLFGSSAKSIGRVKQIHTQKDLHQCRSVKSGSHPKDLNHFLSTLDIEHVAGSRNPNLINFIRSGRLPIQYFFLLYGLCLKHCAHQAVSHFNNWNVNFKPPIDGHPINRWPMVKGNQRAGISLLKEGVSCLKSILAFPYSKPKDDPSECECRVGLFNAKFFVQQSQQP